tara:strand:+ start:460 stop:666 length:207 start_codon:yes stop_codon:yes gene_type:complete
LLFNISIIGNIEKNKNIKYTERYEYFLYLIKIKKIEIKIPNKKRIPFGLIDIKAIIKKIINGKYFFLK